MDNRKANEERLPREVSGRLQFFRFADAPMIKQVGIVLLMVPFLTGLGPGSEPREVSFVRCIPSTCDWSFVSDAKRCRN